MIPKNSLARRPIMLDFFSANITIISIFSPQFGEHGCVYLNKNIPFLRSQNLRCCFYGSQVSMEYVRCTYKLVIVFRNRVKEVHNGRKLFKNCRVWIFDDIGKKKKEKSDRKSTRIEFPIESINKLPFFNRLSFTRLGLSTVAYNWRGKSFISMKR